jgi:hypothetical protein
MSTAARRLACGMLNMGQVNRRMGTSSPPAVDAAALSGVFANKSTAAAIQQLDALLSTPRAKAETAPIPASAVAGVLAYYANSLSELSDEAKATLNSSTAVYVASGTSVNGVLTLDASTWESVTGSILLLPPRVTFRIAGIQGVSYLSSGSVMTITGGLHNGSYDAGAEGVSVPIIYPGGTVSLMFYGASSPACTQPDGPYYTTTTDPTIIVSSTSTTLPPGTSSTLPPTDEGNTTEGTTTLAP